jgi:hypothetical protein
MIQNVEPTTETTTTPPDYTPKLDKIIEQVTQYNEKLTLQNELLTKQNEILTKQQEIQVQESAESTTTIDYTGHLERIADLLQNVQILGQSLLDVLVDVSIMGIGCAIGLVAFKSFFEGAMRW